MENFTPLSALLGGTFIGLATVTLMAVHGRIAGLSGIVSGLFKLRVGDMSWRVGLLLGFVVAGVVGSIVHPESFAVTIDRSTLSLIAGGLIVGFGTRLGSGCTSGHGVCGISRFSRRSIVATCTFMATGFATVAVITLGFGGVL